MSAPDLGDDFGTFDVDEVLEWIDGPVLYTVSNDIGFTMLGLAVQDDAVLFTPISEQRLTSVRTGLVSIRDPFVRPERPNGFVVLTGELETLRVGSAPVQMLPTTDRYLEGKAETAVRFSSEILGRASVNQGRHLVAIELDPPDSHRTEMAVRDESAINLTFQDLVSVVRREGQPTSQEDERDRELLSVGRMAASYVVLLSPSSGDRLATAPSRAFADVLALVGAAQSEPEQFLAQLNGFTRRTRIHLRRFLTALSDAETGVSLFKAEPSGSVDSATVDLPQLRDSVSVLRDRIDAGSRTFTIEGYFDALGRSRRTFTVVELRATGSRKKPRTISGQIDPGILSQIDGKRLGPSWPHRVEIVEETEVGEYDETAKRNSYRLQGIEEITAR